VPGRIGSHSSALAAVTVKRGSRYTSFVRRARTFAARSTVSGVTNDSKRLAPLAIT